MSTTHETQSSAEYQLDTLEGKSLGYCPIARIDCISRCVCYVNAKVVQMEKRVATKEETVAKSVPYWVVYPPYCDNHMFWGE